MPLPVAKSSDVRDRLEKLLGMLGSEHDGERASAALKISDMARERQLMIVELIAIEFGSLKAKPKPVNVFTPKERPAPEREMLNNLDKLRRDPGVWMTEKDDTFVGGVLKRRFADAEMTPKELEWVFDIFKRYGVK